MFTYLLCFSSELKSCVKCEVDVLAYPSLISLMLSADVKHHEWRIALAVQYWLPSYSGSAPKGLLAFPRSHALIVVSSRSVTFLANQLFVSIYSPRRQRRTATSSRLPSIVAQTARVAKRGDASVRNLTDQPFLPPLAQCSVLATCTSYNWFWAC